MRRLRASPIAERCITPFVPSEDSTEKTRQRNFLCRVFDMD